MSILGKKLIVKKVSQKTNKWMVGSIVEITKSKTVMSVSNVECYEVRAFYKGKNIKRILAVDSVEFVDEDECKIFVLKAA